MAVRPTLSDSSAYPVLPAEAGPKETVGPPLGGVRWQPWVLPEPPGLPLGPEWGGLEPPRTQALRRIERRVQGEARVSPNRLARALGRGAWATWQALCDVRGGDGHARVTQAGLARRLGKRERYVELALRRLERAGLVLRKGWRTELLPVPEGSRAPVEVYRRLVLGAWYGDREAGGKAWVPDETEEWLRTACRWGGKRPGAGRKPKNQEGGKINQVGAPSGVILALAGNQEGAPVDTGSKRINGLSLKVLKKELPPAERSAVASHFVDPDRGEPLAKDPPPNRHQPWPLRPRTWTKPRDACGPAVSLQDLPPDPAPRPRRPLRERLAPRSPEGSALASGTALGLGGGYGPPNRRLVPPWELLARPGVPPSPANGGCGQLAVVPPPPKVREEMTTDERVILLARAYRGAVESRTGKPCWAMGGKDPRRWRDYAMMAECAEALLAEDIAPAAWAAWSVDLWRSSRGKDRPPPVRWCLSPKRVEEKAGWFRSEEGGYSGGRVVTGRMHARLWEKWNGMAQEMGDPDNDPAEVLERWFPGDLYERMHEAAQWEAEDYQRRLNRQKAEGRFIW